MKCTECGDDFIPDDVCKSCRQAERMSSLAPCEFSFRVWIHPEDAEVEVWYQDLVPTTIDKRSVAEWAQESFYNEDFHALFGVSNDKHWQIVGKATIRGWYDYWGEYDEEIVVLEFDKAEVPESWFSQFNVEQ